MSQIALPLSQPGQADRIIVGSANAAIVEALQAPEKWPFRIAILRGAFDISAMTIEAVKEFGLGNKDALRCKNMWTLGLA